MRKQRFKIKPQEVAKIEARYAMKVEEFKVHSLEELREIYNTKKMSANDREALVYCADVKIKEKMALEAQLIESTPQENGSIDAE